jgi:RNA polymerase sigma factor (sigma-70 family)
MELWKKNRNYRKVRRKDGGIVYIITIDDEDHFVPIEVYKAYSQADRRERYLVEAESAERILSIEKMAEDGVRLEKHTIACAESAETLLVSQEEAAEREAMLKVVGAALLRLPCEDRTLIYSLFFQGVSARQLAQNLGVSDMAIRKRRDRILDKLKILLKKSVP